MKFSDRTEMVPCAYCKKPYLRLKKEVGSRRLRIRILARARPSRTITCSKKCSLAWQHYTNVGEIRRKRSKERYWAKKKLAQNISIVQKRKAVSTT